MNVVLQITSKEILPHIARGRCAGNARVEFVGLPCHEGGNGVEAEQPARIGQRENIVSHALERKTEL